MSELLAKDKSVVVPGEKLAEGMDYLPSHGTYREGDFIYSKMLGLVNINGRTIKLIPLAGRYLPKKGDVIIKGANALDPKGIAGIYLHDPFGGTIRMGIGPAMARGVELIIPVGLEKLIPTPIEKFANEIGKGRVEQWIGMNFGIMPIMGNVVTEIEAFRILTGVEATIIGGGGVNGAEGAYHFLLKGDIKSVKDAYDLVKKIKGEPPYRPISFIPLSNFKNAEINFQVKVKK